MKTAKTDAENFEVNIMAHVM